MAELTPHDFTATLILRTEHRTSYEVQGFYADGRLEAIELSMRRFGKMTALRKPHLCRRICQRLPGSLLGRESTSTKGLIGS